MAFVNVTTPKSPAGIAGVLLKCRSGKQELTPKLCYEVLQSTNFAKNIRDMLTMIAELPAEKQADFKEVVLSTFDRREQPNDILVLGKKLAVAGGYEDDLNNVGEIGDVEGEYLFSGVGKRAGIAVSKIAKTADYSKYEEVFVNVHKPELSPSNLSSVKKMRFKDGAYLGAFHIEEFPADFDVSMCDKVNFNMCDLAQVKELRFKDGAMVYFSNVENLPADLDVSMCDEVLLNYCQLKHIKNLRFKDGAKVDLSSAMNLPEKLDVSMCSEISLCDADFYNVKEVRFRNPQQEEKCYAYIPESVKVTYSEKKSNLWARIFQAKSREA